MKLIWFFTWRDIRFRWRNLIAFSWIASALIFALVSQITFQESASAEPWDYMTTPSYLILLTAFSLIGFVAARTYFSLYNENFLTETGIQRALGMKRWHITGIRIMLGIFCIVISFPAVLLALLFVRLYVQSCASGDMTISNFAPLIFRIPLSNIFKALFLLTSAMLSGVFFSSVKEKNIVRLLKQSKLSPEAENGSSTLPEEGTLYDYGKLVVRRSIKRCAKYNLITVFLLILPIIYLLSASTFQSDFSAHSFN